MNNKYDGLTVIWGAGKLYHTYKHFIENEYGIDYICDRAISVSDCEYEGYRIISSDQIKEIGKCRIILCMLDEDEMDKIKASFHSEQNEILRLIDLMPVSRKLCSKEILPGILQGEYKDCYGNVIKCESPEFLDKISIRFDGENGQVTIGKKVCVAKQLEIECGNKGSVIIGDNTTFDDVVIYSAYAGVSIGNDCMVSYGVFIRNHDSHFIFDKVTGKRINYSRDISIGNHVWIGQGVLLLAGFSIEEGSVIGAGSVSSSSFGNNQVVAGNPARIIRSDVCWDRSMTWTKNYDHISDISSDYCFLS